MDYSLAHQLARTIQASDEYKSYHQLKQDVMADATTAALIKEFRKLQVTLQMSALSGQQPDPSEMQRFSGISALLYGKPEAAQFLVSEMALQTHMHDVMKIITDAFGIEIELPGV